MRRATARAVVRGNDRADFAPLREGYRVSAAFYGHPGVGVDPAYAAIRRARQEGYPARMLPGISAEVCSIAELEVDPLEKAGKATRRGRL